MPHSLQLHWLVLFCLSYVLVCPPIPLLGRQVQPLDVALIASFLLTGRLAFDPQARRVQRLILALTGVKILSNLVGYAFLNVPYSHKDFREVRSLLEFLIAFRLGYALGGPRLVGRKTLLLLICLCVGFSLLVIAKHFSPQLNDAISVLYGSPESDTDYLPLASQRTVLKDGNPNQQSILLVQFLAVPLAFWTMGKSKTIWAFLASAAVVSLGVFSLACMASRGAILSLVSALATLVVICRGRISSARLVVGLAIVAAAAILAVSSVPVLTDRFASLTPTSTGKVPYTVSYRLATMHAGVRKWLTSPILGSGDNWYFRSSPGRDAAVGVLRSTNPHSQYVGFLQRNGLLGLILYLALMRGLLRLPLTNAVQPHRPDLSLLARISLLQLLTVLFFNLQDETLRSYPLMVVVGLFSGNVYGAGPGGRSGTLFYKQRRGPTAPVVVDNRFHGALSYQAPQAPSEPNVGEGGSVSGWGDPGARR